MGQSHELTLTPSNLALCVRQMYLNSSELSAFQRLSDNLRVPNVQNLRHQRAELSAFQTKAGSFRGHARRGTQGAGRRQQRGRGATPCRTRAPPGSRPAPGTRACSEPSTRPCDRAGHQPRSWTGFMSRAGLSPSDPRQTFWSDPQRLTSAVWSAVPPLLFGLRLWVAVCLALYIAFWLELDNPYCG